MKQKIEIDVPDGYEVERVIKSEETLSTKAFTKIIWQKKKPRRRVFEETGEYRQVGFREIYEAKTGDLRKWCLAIHSDDEYPIFKEIIENETEN